MVWVLVMTMYLATSNTVIDWDGPWQYGQSSLVERTFQTEGECRDAAIQMIGRIHQGMLVPVRYKCVRVEATLPKGALR